MSLKAMIWVMEDAPVENGTELNVLYALADRANDDGTGAYPSQEWISFRARCSDRTVRTHLKNLEKRGVILRGNQAIVSHYPASRRPIVWDLNYDSVRPERWCKENPVGRKILPGGDSASHGRKLSAEWPEAQRTSDRKPASDKPSSQPSAEPSLNHTSSITDGGGAEKAKTYPDEFEEFWKAYPTKAGKRAALKRWREAIEDGNTHEHLTAAARSYRELVETTGTKYIKHAQGWLNDGRYDDDYPTLIAQARSANAPQQTQGSSDISAWLGYDPNAQSDIVDAEIVDTKELPSWTG